MTNTPRNRVSGGGSYRIDRLLNRLGLPRLQVASGTTCPDEFRRVNEFVSTLIELEDRELLRALIERRLTPLELFRRKSGGGLLKMRAELAATSGNSAERIHGASADTGRPSSACEDATSRGAAPAHAPVAVVTGARADAGAEDARELGTSVKVISDIPSSTPKARVGLWPVLLSEKTWSGSKAGDKSRTRYTQSLKGLRTRLRLIGAREDVHDTLGELSSEQWHALDHARRRGVSVPLLREIIANAWLPRKNKLKTRNGRKAARTYSMENRKKAARVAPKHIRELRLGHQTLMTLASLNADQWEAIAAVGPDVVSHEIFEACSGVTSQDEVRLRRLGPRLSEDADIGALLSIQPVDWQALNRAWGASATDWNKARVALSAALTLALGRGNEQRARVLHAIPRVREKEHSTTLTPAQFRTMMDSADEYWCAVFTTLVASGMRIGEYLRCTREDLRPSIFAIEVPGTKTEESRGTVKVAPRYWPYVEAAIPSAVGYTKIRKEWLRLCEAHGVADARRLHDLRHCHGQWAVDAGVPERDVQVSLRHATPGQTRRYTKRKQVTTVADGLGELDLAQIKGE